MRRHDGVMARSIPARQLMELGFPAIVPEDLRDARVVPVAQQGGGGLEGNHLPQLPDARQRARTGTVGHLQERGRFYKVEEYL